VKASRLLLDRLGHSAMTDECGGGIEPRLAGEALGQRWDIAVGQIEFHAFQPVHGEEDHAGRKRLAILDQGYEIVERSQFDAAQTQPFRSERKDGPPKLLPRIAECNQHHDASAKRIPTWMGKRVAPIHILHQSDCRRDPATLQPQSAAAHGIAGRG